MRDENHSTQDEQFEAYLDGTLSGAAYEAFHNRVMVENHLRVEAELQGRINYTLCKLFPVVDPPSRLNLQSVLRNEQTAAYKSRFPLRLLITGAAAILIACTLLLRTGDQLTPFFQATPVAQIYAETIRDG